MLGKDAVEEVALSRKVADAAAVASSAADRALAAATQAADFKAAGSFVPQCHNTHNTHLHTHTHTPHTYTHAHTHTHTHTHVSLPLAFCTFSPFAFRVCFFLVMLCVQARQQKQRPLPR